MRTTKHLLIAIAFAFLVVPMITHSPGYGAEPVYVGLMAPMTGDYAEYGMFFKQGMEVAIDQVNKAGGIKGRMVEIVVGDSRADPKEAALVAQKFTAILPCIIKATCYIMALSEQRRCHESDQNSWNCQKSSKTGYSQQAGAP